MMIHRSSFLTAGLVALVIATPSFAIDNAPGGLTDEVRSQCIAVLVGALDAESPWVRVHAGEALAILNHPEPVVAAFRPQVDTAPPEYRIGVWRVLAQAETKDGRSAYIERVRRAFLDSKGPDQTHAIEALAKLNCPASDDAERQRIREVANGDGAAAPFALWRLAQAGDSTVVARLAGLLKSPDEAMRLRAAYVLGRLQPLAQDVDKALAAAIADEPGGSVAHSVMRSAQGVETARKMAQEPAAPQHARYFAAMRLAELGTADDYPLLSRLSKDPDLDVRVAATFATLQIEKRAATSTHR